MVNLTLQALRLLESENSHFLKPGNQKSWLEIYEEAREQVITMRTTLKDVMITNGRMNPEEAEEKIKQTLDELEQEIQNRR